MDSSSNNQPNIPWILMCDCGKCKHLCEACGYSHTEDQVCKRSCMFCGKMNPDENCRVGTCFPNSAVCEKCGYAGPEIISSARKIAAEKGEVFMGCCDPTYMICDQCKSTKEWW